jgi:integrase
MRSNLDRAARIIGAYRADAVRWHAMTPAHMRALAAALGDRYSPATANATLAAIRGVLRAAWDLGLLDRETLERVTRDHNGKAHKVRGSTPPTGRHLEPGELVALFRAAATDPLPARGARDAALLAVLDGGGLRRAEAVALDLDDVDFEEEAVTVRRGKGAEGEDGAACGWRWKRVARMGSGSGRRPGALARSREQG